MTYHGSDGKTLDGKVETIVGNLMEQGGRLVISVDLDKDDPVMVGCEFGREAEDSNMYGGAAYGIGETVDSCLDQVLEETGWGP